MSSPKSSKELKGTALAARRRFSQFVTSLSFHDFMARMSPQQLTDLLSGLGVTEPGFQHDPALTPIVHQLLEGNQSTLSTAERVFLAANEVENLLDNPTASLQHPDPISISGHGVFQPTAYLPMYREWLMRQRYEPWPGLDKIDKLTHIHEFTAATSKIRRIVIQESVAGVLSRYTQWTTLKLKAVLAFEKKQFKVQLAQDPPLPPEAQVVIKAYLWALPAGDKE